jgi:SNARE protein 1
LVEPLVIPTDKGSEPFPISPGESSSISQTNEDDPVALVSQMLLPSEELSPTVTATASLLPPTSENSPEKPSMISPEFLTASRQTQDEISQRLAEMAVQLRRNAQQFSAALEDDKEALREADSKLDTNYTVMQKERGRLSTYSTKSRSTTWMVVLSISVVGIAWIVMFFLIRVTNIV